MSAGAKVVTLSTFRSNLSRSLRRRGENLLSSVDSKEEIAALEPVEAFLIFKEMGPGNSQALLRQASQEQIQAFLDLDCWRKNKPSVNDIDLWLASYAQQDVNLLAEAFCRLDEELQILFLMDTLEVYDLRNEEEPDDQKEDDVFVRTPDDLFLIRFTPKNERNVDPILLLNSIYKNDAADAHQLLMAVKWELKAPLEESAFTFRNGRLEDLGFPSAAEAQRIFVAPTKLSETVRRGVSKSVSTLPALYAQPFTEASLFALCLARIKDGAVLEDIQRELGLLINCAIIAYGESPQDIEYIGEVATTVRDTLSLGLEAMLAEEMQLEDSYSEEFLAAGENTVLKASLEHIFRHGFQLLRGLNDRTQELFSDEVFAAWFQQDDDAPDSRADKAFLSGLLFAHPILSGFDKLDPHKQKSFSKQSEILEAQDRLEALLHKFL